jgi:hypothetical protein
MKKCLIYMLGVAFCLIVPRVSLACSCNVSHLAGKSEKYQVNYARKHADAVFSGVVTEIVIDEKSHTYEAKFRVRALWKGVDSKEVSLFGGTDCCFCQYEFKVGESYVVYAILDKEGDRLATSICQRTKPMSEAAKDLKYLGKSRIVVSTRGILESGRSITTACSGRATSLSSMQGLSLAAVRARR